MMRSASALASIFACSIASRLELLADRDDLRRARLGFRQHFRVALLRTGELAPALLAGREAVGDLLLARLDGAHQRRPDESRAEPDEEAERDGLHDQGQIEVHDRPSSTKEFGPLGPTWHDGQQRVGEREEHREADADDVRRVDQAEEQEDLRLQLRHQLRLAGRAFQEARAHDAHAHARAERAQADHEADADCRCRPGSVASICIFHFSFPFGCGVIDVERN